MNIKASGRRNIMNSADYVNVWGPHSSDALSAQEVLQILKYLKVLAKKNLFVFCRKNHKRWVGLPEFIKLLCIAQNIAAWSL